MTIKLLHRVTLIIPICNAISGSRSAINFINRDFTANTGSVSQQRKNWSERTRRYWSSTCSSYEKNPDLKITVVPFAVGWLRLWHRRWTDVLLL